MRCPGLKSWDVFISVVDARLVNIRTFFSLAVVHLINFLGLDLHIQSIRKNKPHKKLYRDYIVDSLCRDGSNTPITIEGAIVRYVYMYMNIHVYTCINQKMVISLTQ